MSELTVPKEWVECNISDVISANGVFCDGDWVESKDQDPNGDVRLIQLADIGDGYFKNKSERFLTKGKAETLNCTFLNKGDLLIARLPDPLGRACVFPLREPNRYVTVVDVCIVRPTAERINSHFLLHLINSPRIRAEIEKYKSGTTRKRISRKNLAKVFLPIASMPEQNKIVSVIEQLFSDLDNAIDNLKKAREQLKIYRQAVLKSAFNGVLTDNWRKSRRNLTSASDLIEKIKQERETLNDSKYGKRHRRMDTSFTDVNKPPYNLPPQWIWCRIKDLIFDLTDYHANGSYENLKANVALFDAPNYALMIRATNFEKNDFITVAKYITKEAYEFLSRSKLFGGEILIGKIGNAGKVYFMPYLNKPASLAMNLFALRFSIINPKYIYYHLISAFSEKDITSHVKGVGNPTIDKKSIRSILIALPSLEEQEAVIQEIESRFSVCDKMEEVIDNSLNQAEALRQSILKQAFEGKLTEQWRKEHPELISGENSAKALLERIRKEREALKNTKKRKK